MLYYQNDALHASGHSLESLANTHGTPLFVYSKEAMNQNAQAFLNTPGVRPFYAVKANDRLAVLRVMDALGFGFAIVSLGELHKLLHLRIDPDRIVFSGSAKTDEELRLAIVSGIHAIQVESMSEIDRIVRMSEKLQIRVRIGLRINPSIQAKTHRYIATGDASHKFGIPSTMLKHALSMIKKSQWVRLVGLSAHVGSMIFDPKVYEDLIVHLGRLCARFNLELEYLNVGGGMGVAYKNESVFSIASLLERLVFLSPSLVYVEPGRSIVANAGVLLSKVIATKTNEGSHHFLFLDAGMNDLVRPSLYQSYHRIENLSFHSSAMPKTYQVVGPICESADVFSPACTLSARAGDFVAIYHAGAYASVMSSQYNARLRAAEVLLDGEDARVVVRREVMGDIYKRESE